ncbi:iron-siderophore ABC transporter substrate-binding protein [Brevibacillus sp. SYP-B805]|uniref:ABC transporter substrate-binding protein n=1 Tax=Brevibacillus sp. SYP-B805 TaxID=1578199 RepID=UPI0013EB88E7|nr:iron-siderophore ABC transporter substrate-binding protein [Brevibacillus sp. SYP-B805]NGQ96906.1 iron-siderophore ABC transporter substrate-binding protein [Brevibacillus sp. SYP-B805]
MSIPFLGVHRRKRAAGWLVVLAMMLLLAGCGQSAPGPSASADTSAGASAASSTSASAPSSSDAANDGKKTVKHVWGETPIQGIPQKVVALDFYIVDTLVSLGVQPAGIAGTGDTRVPAYIKDQVGTFTDLGERKEPNLEVIRSLGPDLIIANPERAKMIRGELEKIGPTIALSDVSYQTILENVDLLADVFGKPDQAKKVRADLEAKIKQAKEKIGKPSSVLVVGVFEDDMSVWVKNSFIASLMTDIGLNYVFEGEKEKTEGNADIATLTVERLAELNPDVLFLYGDGIAKLKENPLFAQLKAAKEQHVYEVDRDLWSRSRGPIAAGLIVEEAEALLNGKGK